MGYLLLIMPLHQTCDEEMNWATCPADILFQIYAKLDTTSLINCMAVNQVWENVVEYYFEHFNLWPNVIKHGIENGGVTITEKSNFDWKDQFLRAQQWLNVRSATVHLQHHFRCKCIRNICIYKENLIITAGLDVKYFNIENYEFLRTIDSPCLKYEETSFLIAELSLPCPSAIGYNVLTLKNKLNNNFNGESARTMTLLDISLFKVHSNCCYVIDIKNVLWIYTARDGQWESRALAKYYGNRDSMCCIHIYRESVYVMLTRGDVLLVDLECKKFKKVFQFGVPLHYLDTKLFMFHNYSALFKVQSDQTLKIYPDKDKSIIAVACPSLACVLEHGHSLILGYEDGKIEIFIIRKLLEECTNPELRFYLQNYLEDTLLDHKITALEVYEGQKGHHLFVATAADVYEFVLSY